MTAASHPPAPNTSSNHADGGEAARVESLVRVHLPLVGHIVRDTLSRLPAHVHRDDLVSAGMCALTVAAQSFDASVGAPFGAYAAIRIRGAIADELRGLDWATRGVRSRARQVDDVRNELTASLGRVPTAQEVASASGFTARELDAVDAKVAQASVVSLQAMPTEASETLMPVSAMQPEALLVHREQMGYLRDAIAELPDRLRVVIEGHFFEQRLMSDMAAELGVTDSRVSQLRREGLDMLRAAMTALDREDDGPTKSAGRGRAAAQAAYCAAVASRSTLATRLQATNEIAELRPTADAVRVTT